VISARASLVMNPGAKVELHGAPVGTVAAIKDMPDRQAAIRLAQWNFMMMTGGESDG
jgi:phospholipid/cholesterol/gamma-HCH transport system substrate-binding protein